MKDGAAVGQRRHLPSGRTQDRWWNPATAPTQTVPSLGLGDAVAAFLIDRRGSNCSRQTLSLYASILSRFQRGTDVLALDDVTPLVVSRHLAGLLETMQPITAHCHYRCLRTFFGWCQETGLVNESHMLGLAMHAPKTLPRVPENEEVRRLLAACPDTFEGLRNRALVGLLADSGLRVSEALNLRAESLDFAERRLRVRSGKGQKDGVGFFGVTTATLLRAWLAARGELHPEAFVFCDRRGRPLTRTHATHILHRLSVKAGLTRKVGPHALRHYAATAILRRTGDIDLVRRVLRHETLAMTLRYVAITQADVAVKFQTASPLDHLRAGR